MDNRLMRLEPSEAAGFATMTGVNLWITSSTWFETSGRRARLQDPDLEAGGRDGCLKWIPPSDGPQWTPSVRVVRGAGVGAGVAGPRWHVRHTDSGALDRYDAPGWID